MEEIEENNANLRNKAKTCMNEAILNYPKCDTSGHNFKDSVEQIEIEGRSYLLPPHSEYHSVDISQITKKIGRRRFKVKFSRVIVRLCV